MAYAQSTFGASPMVAEYDRTYPPSTGAKPGAHACRETLPVPYHAVKYPLYFCRKKLAMYKL